MSKVPYLAPNFITVGAMTCGLAAMFLAHRGQYVEASWLLLFSTLLDRADGLVARSLRATSAFGVQMDSFADFFNFGVVPSFLVYSALTRVPELQSGGGHLLVLVAAAAWVFACTFRLARFNVIADDPRYRGLFFGIPTTLAAGMLATWFLTLMKYSGPGAALGGRDQFAEPRLLGDLVLPAGAWVYLPIAMLVGAVLMVSNLRIRKPSGGRSLVGALILLVMLSGLVFGVLRMFPEYLLVPPTLFTLIWLLRQPSRSLRSIAAPPRIPVARAEQP